MLFCKVRCHASIIVANLLKVVFPLVVGLGYVLTDTTKLKAFFNIKNTVDITAFAVLVTVFMFAFYILLRFFAWRRTYVSLNKERLIYDKRTLFFQKKVEVRLSEVATVHLQKSIIDRLFDTQTVKLCFDMRAPTPKNNFRFVFRSHIAKDFIVGILGSNNSADALHVVATFENQSPVVTFASFKILQHALLITPIWGVVALGAAFAGVTLPFAKLSPIWYPVIFLAGLPVAFFVAFIASVIRTFIRYYGFKLYKLKGELVITFGLITQHTFRLPIQKTNAVLVRQSIFGRIFGRYYAEVLQVGMGDKDKRIAPVLCLMMEKKQIERLIHVCFADIVDPLSVSNPPKTAYLPYFLRGAVFVIPILCGMLAVGTVYPILYFVVFITVIIWGLLSFAEYRAQGISVTKRYLVVARGILDRIFLLVPYQKIRKISTQSGPISRLLGLQIGKIFILSAIAHRKKAIGYFKNETFRQIIQTIESER